VSFDEIVGLAIELFGRHLDRSYVYSKYVRRLVQAGRLKRIRRGLYVVLAPLEKEASVDKLLVASKIRSQYFLGFHTALEFYGCAYSTHNEVYLCVRPETRFDPFDFGRFRFRPVFIDDVESEVEVRAYRGHKLRVSSKERTFVECLDRVEYAGGWEECLKSLQNLGGLDFDKIRRIAVEDQSEILLRRVGFVLGMLKDRSMFYEHLGDDVLEKLESKISQQPRYLIRGLPGPRNDRWRLYVPEGFEEKLRGV